MSAQNAERERIVKTIENIRGTFTPESFVNEQIASWHLAEVKRIVEPLYESESIILHNQSDDKNHYSANQERKFGIAKALKRANGGE